MHDGVDTAQGMAEGEVITEVAEGDLDLDTLGPQAPGVADQAAHRRARGHQATENDASDGSGRPGQQQHRREGTETGASVECGPRRSAPALWKRN